VLKANNAIKELGALSEEDKWHALMA